MPSTNHSHFQNHNRTQSAVNSQPIVNAQPKRIQNRVYRMCAKDGFEARIKAEIAAELTGNVPHQPPLYSHHATRQSYYNLGWHAVTPIHVLRAKAQAKNNNKEK